MSSSSALPEEEKIIRAPSPFGAVYDLLEAAIEERATAKKREIEERMYYNKINALQEFVATYPEIPITFDTRTTSIQVRVDNFQGRRCSFLPEGGDTFYLHRFPCAARAENLTEVAFRDGNLETVRTYPYEEGQTFYLGKYLLEAAPGEEYHEDETAVYVAPQKEGKEVDYYLLNMYRNGEGLVVSTMGAFDKNLYNESCSIEHFGGVPWHVKTRIIGDYTDVIFRNLHVPHDIRRYIIRASRRCEFLMLRGEFYFLRKTSNARCKIVRCCNDQEVLGRENETFSVSDDIEQIVCCREYVAILKDDCRGITILSVLD
jgi:hypothetical protein